jgi:hypothetical protein
MLKETVPDRHKINNLQALQNAVSFRFIPKLVAQRVCLRGIRIRGCIVERAIAVEVEKPDAAVRAEDSNAGFADAEPVCGKSNIACNSTELILIIPRIEDTIVVGVQEPCTGGGTINSRFRMAIASPIAGGSQILLLRTDSNPGFNASFGTARLQ